MSMTWTNAWASDLSVDELVGKWEFLHWADSGNLDNTHDVGLVMEFMADGTVTTYMPNKSVTERYQLSGSTIIYSDKRGDQEWKVVSFVPGNTLVVDNFGAVMTLEKR